MRAHVEPQRRHEPELLGREATVDDARADVPKQCVRTFGEEKLRNDRVNLAGFRASDPTERGAALRGNRAENDTRVKNRAALRHGARESRLREGARRREARTPPATRRACEAPSGS